MQQYHDLVKHILNNGAQKSKTTQLYQFTLGLALHMSTPVDGMSCGYVSLCWDNYLISSPDSHCQIKQMHPCSAPQHLKYAPFQSCKGAGMLS